jgi:hypothetical protein
MLNYFVLFPVTNHEEAEPFGIPWGKKGCSHIGTNHQLSYINFIDTHLIIRYILRILLKAN